MIILNQHFHENCDYGDEKREYKVDSSVGAYIKVDGDNNGDYTKLTSWSENCISMSAERPSAKNGISRYITVYISGAVVYNGGDDRTAENTAAENVRYGADKSYDSIHRDTTQWFAGFWSKKLYST